MEHSGNKALIVVAAQEDRNGIGRIRMRRIPDASAKSLVPFLQESAEPGNAVHTDGWLGYDPLETNGHHPQDHVFFAGIRNLLQSCCRVFIGLCRC